MNRTIAYTIMGIFVLLFLIGMFAEEPQLPPTKWVENPKMKRPAPRKSAREANKPLPETRTYLSLYDYEIDNSDTWDEFLEDIEMRGLEYTDPDAVEIWELEYK